MVKRFADSPSEILGKERLARFFSALNGREGRPFPLTIRVRQKVAFQLVLARNNVGIEPIERYVGG